MATVYIEPRPKGRPDGDRSMIMLLRTTRTTSSPPSRRSARQSSGRRKTAMRPTSLASGT